MAAHQAPPSLGFSRQEHWSGLPFPSPMHKSESEVAQSCPTLRDPMDCSLPGSSIHGIFQARVLEWGAIAFSVTRVRWYLIVVLICISLVISNVEHLFMPVSHLYVVFGELSSSAHFLKSFWVVWAVYIGGLVTRSCPTLVTPWTVACQAPLSMGFSRQEYWSGHFLLQGIFPAQELNPGLLHCRQIFYQLSYKGSPAVYIFWRLILCQLHHL